MSKRTISEHLRKRIAEKVESGEIETPEVIARIRGSQPDPKPSTLAIELDDEVEVDEDFDIEEVEEEGMDVIEAFNALVEERDVYVALQEAHQAGYMGLLEQADRNPYPEDDPRHESWSEGFQDAIAEAEVVRVVVAAMGLLEAETEADTAACFEELEAAVNELTEVEALIEFWEKATSDG